MAIFQSRKSRLRQPKAATMARDQAYFAAEEIIEKIRSSKGKDKELTLSVKHNAPNETKLTELPESIKKLSWLEELNLSGNNLVGLPN